jgi:DNA-binding transcriptional MocR family regulator
MHMPVQSYLSGDSAVKIAASVEHALAAGRASGGESLPPVRTLASHLSVSPATVAAAYRLLQDRGIVVAEGRRGTRLRNVSPALPPTRTELPRGVRDLATGNPDPELLPDIDAAMARLRPGRRLYGDELNHPPLAALARKQFREDGVDGAHLAIVSGAMDGLERVLREHLRAGDRVIVEDPCFTGVLDLLNALSLTPLPVALDDEGLDPAGLREALRGTAGALIVTPRAQNPTGAAFSERRARQLRALLRDKSELLVIEDDHAGPVAGATYRTITPGLERWAVVRSVSKSLGPDLRVAVVAGDARTLARVEGRQNLGIRWVSHILQQLVAALWRDKSVQKQLAAAARVYAERRDALVQALRARGLEAHAASGLNVWIPLRDEAAVVNAMLRRGWAVNAGERYRIRSGPAIRVTVATLAAGDAETFAGDLGAIVFGTNRASIS